MNGPRQLFTSTISPRALGNDGRRELERRVQVSRREAVAWVDAGSNAENIGAYLTSYDHTSSPSVPALGRTLADYVALLSEWGVPGLTAPAGLDPSVALRWSRSVALAVLQHLRQGGHLAAATPTSNTARRSPGLHPPVSHRPRHQGVSPHAGASPAHPKVTAMSETPLSHPHPPTDHESEGALFPAVKLTVDGRNLHLERLDAQAAVDHARQQNIAARHALRADLGGTAAAPVRSAADAASAVLRAAVDVLTALDELDGSPGADLAVDIDIDGAITVVRPHGDLDLFTSPRLEQACVEQVDDRTPELLVVDLSAVTFLDSSALAVLVEIHRICLLGNTRFAVTGPTARARQLLAITHLDTVLDVI